ncbi:MAG: DUF1684 domain-containing protein [Bryobacteraceae bacterium]
MYSRNSIGIVFLLVFLAACNPNRKAAGPEYYNSVQAWQKHRVDGLRKPDSWLTLVGLFWLKPGANTIGSGQKNDFVLPKGSAPERAGTFQVDGQRVTYIGTDKTQTPVDYGESDPTVIRAGTVAMTVIKREDRLGIRAKDSESPVLKNFKGSTFFPIDPDLHFTARFLPDQKKIPILNVLGQTEMETSPGVVQFIYKGEKYKLRPIYEGKTLFFLFKDPTNKTGTYQAGRMLNTPLPANGKVDLDFNRSYNPPCTYTPYATCPLPPKENSLRFPVTAGEKRYGNGHVEYQGSSDN